MIAKSSTLPCIVDWRAHRKGDKIGTVAVLFPSGMILREITIHCRDSGVAWAAPPARARLADGTNEWLHDEAGHPLWEPIVSFTDANTRRRWSAQIIAALRLDRPGVLPEEAIPDPLDEDLRLFPPPGHPAGLPGEEDEA
jgi:hypothetical protein